MGSNYSRQVMDSVTESVNNSVTEVINTMESRADLNLYANQTIRANFDYADLTKCPVTVRQTSNAKVASFLDVNNNVTADIANDLKNTIREKIENTLEQVNSGLNLGQFNTADIITRTQTYATNNIENIIKTGISNVATMTSSHNQTIEFSARHMICRDSPINLSQEQMIEAIVSNIADNIVDNIVTNSAANDLIKEASNKVSQLNKGIDLGFGLLFILIIIGIIVYLKIKGLKALFSKKGIIFVIIIIIGIVLYFVTKRFIIPEAAR